MAFESTGKWCKKNENQCDWGLSGSVNCGLRRAELWPLDSLKKRSEDFALGHVLDQMYDIQIDHRCHNECSCGVWDAVKTAVKGALKGYRLPKSILEGLNARGKEFEMDKERVNLS